MKAKLISGRSGKILLAALFLFSASPFLIAGGAASGHVPHSPEPGEECLACHGERSLTTVRAGKTVSLFVDAKKFSASIHGTLGCTGCHADITEYPHPQRVARVNCGVCHSGEGGQYTRSVHGKAIARGDPLAPRCVNCHGNHDILPVSNPDSAVAPLKVPFVCGGCHREGSPVQLYRNIPQSNILENYSESLHGEALLRMGLTVAPNCATCHSPHLILPPSDPASSIARQNIAKTCTKCHADIEQVHRRVIRGELWEKQAHVLPTCVDCHQPHKIQKVSYSQSMADADCMRCHANERLTRARDGASLYVRAAELVNSRHAKVACSQCHSEVTVSRVRPCETITHKVDCTACHAQIGQEFQTSIHGNLLAQHNPNAPTCLECHGTHGVLGRLNRQSPTFPTNVPDLCAQCHREGEKAAVRYTGAEHQIIRQYTESIHGKGLLQSGLTVTATCTSCHTAHRILPHSDHNSSVNPQNVPNTCGVCHSGIRDQFDHSVHSPLVTKTTKPLPVCNDCHSAHSIRRVDEAGFRLAIMQTCGRCHEQLANAYFDTFHGKVSRLGYTKTAKCYDCHGAHDILPVTDPRSHLSRVNIVATCQKCHAGATRRFAGYLTHATHHDPRKYPFLFYAFWGMTALLVGTFVVSGVHTLLWLPRAFQMRRELRAAEMEKTEQSQAETQRTPEIAPAKEDADAGA
jgi:Cytochrome c7 and related cytochrome c